MSEDSSKVIPLTRIQKLIGQRMLQSKRNQPCFYMSAKAEICGVAELRRSVSKQVGVKVSINDFFIRAMAVATEKYPLMVGSFRNEYIQIADSINIGFAVAAPKGLMVPVVKNANTKSVADIAKETAELIDKARDGKLKLDEITGGSITLTALGMFGIDSFFAIPLPQQCSIISAGKIFEEPVFSGDNIVMKKFIEFGLTADSRIVGYDYAAQFLVEMTNLISNPQKLIDIPPVK
jgi:pyruvate dehydrogenase E2 component (dihydrolipoamide acetyltransferase)